WTSPVPIRIATCGVRRCSGWARVTTPRRAASCARSFCRTGPMTRAELRAALAGLILAAPLAAQSIADRLARVEGRAQVLFDSKPDVCGDGASYVERVFGTRGRVGTNAGSNWTRACVHGPVRVVATVVSGEI